jgi:uroporphyrinogen-III synthase
MSETVRQSRTKPLSGVRVLVGRARHQAGALSAELRKLGATVIEIPFIEIRKPRSFKPLDSALKNLAHYDWLILTSANGVEAMWERMQTLGLSWTGTNRKGKNREGNDFSRAGNRNLSVEALAAEPTPLDLRIAAIGPATKKAIERHGAKVDVVPKEYVAEAVVRSLHRRVKGKRVLLVRAKIARDVIPRELIKGGAQVDVVEAYETVVPQSSRKRLQSLLANPKRRPDVVTFTSSSTVKNFVALLNLRKSAAGLQGIAMASIGPVTSATLREMGLPVDIEARQYTIPGLTAAIVGRSSSPIAPVGMRANRRMQRLLKRTGSPKRLAPKLKGILDAGLVERDECLLLASEAARSFGRELMDALGYECFANHIHIADFEQAWLYANELTKMLSRSRFGKCAVLVSFDGKDATVRFHRIRPGQSWLSENLEGYQEEAIAVLYSS